MPNRHGATNRKVAAIWRLLPSFDLSAGLDYQEDFAIAETVDVKGRGHF